MNYLAVIYFYIDENDVLQGSQSCYKVEMLIKQRGLTGKVSVQQSDYKTFTKFKGVLHNEEWLG